MAIFVRAPDAVPTTARDRDAELRLLHEILERLTRIEARFDKRPALDAASAALLLELAAVTRGTAFTSRELVLRVDRGGVELRDRLARLRILAAPRLGRWLRKHVGGRVGDRTRARIGQESGGAIWSFVE
jgi:hypothetical protein